MGIELVNIFGNFTTHMAGFQGGWGALVGLVGRTEFILKLLTTHLMGRYHKNEILLCSRNLHEVLENILHC